MGVRPEDPEPAAARARLAHGTGGGVDVEAQRVGAWTEHGSEAGDGRLELGIGDAGEGGVDGSRAAERREAQGRVTLVAANVLLDERFEQVAVRRNPGRPAREGSGARGFALSSTQAAIPAMS